jgi:thiosulfate dehydrogenase [quinone] large subunit
LTCINAAGAAPVYPVTRLMRDRRRQSMTNMKLQNGLILFFRLAMGWTFLYAGVWQLLSHDFTAASFLTHTKTFHDFFVLFTNPTVLPITDFMVKWGHLLIGLSLVSGLMVRVSGPFGILLLGVYYFAHLDFPYVESNVNFIMDFHLVYMGVITWLIAMRAGHVWGLDGLVEKTHLPDGLNGLRPLFG